MSFLPVGYTDPEDNEDLMGIRTHSRYVLNVYKLIDGNHIIFDLGRTSNYGTLTNEQKILKKLEIVKYTLESIKTENTFSQQEEDFLPLSLSWLWIKGYYAVFHLASLLISFEKGDSRYMTDRKYNDHLTILSIINQIILSNRPFNLSRLNNNYSGTELNSFKTADHLNLKNVATYNEDLFKLSLKKVYSEEIKVKLKGIRGSKRSKQLAKINTKRYSIFDLFHYYRERFNYSGFQYLDCEDLPYNSLELKKFYFSSYIIISSIATIMVNYLINKTTGKINSKLVEIKKLYEPI